MDADGRAKQTVLRTPSPPGSSEFSLSRLSAKPWRQAFQHPGHELGMQTSQGSGEKGPKAKFFFLAASCLLSQSCALVQNEKALDAQTFLIGRSRAEIMACAGIPNEDARSNGKEIAIYSAAARYSASGTVLGIKNCTVNIVFDAGRVSEINYVVDDPGIYAPFESCAEIVSTCLR